MRSCMTCANGETAEEKYGDMMHDYEVEDVFCAETQKLETFGATTFCSLWKRKATK